MKQMKRVLAVLLAIALVISGLYIVPNTYKKVTCLAPDEYGEYIIGRMGIPYRQKGINIISVAIDAPNDVINSLTGKIGMLPGISTKTV